MKRALFLIALLCAWAIPAWGAPSITVSASAVSILGTSQPISITVTLLDPNFTGNLRVAGTGVIPIMQASTVTPGTTATVGPIYGNDVIVDGYGNVNGTYYKVQVFTVTNGIIASTASLQNFYAFTGSGTVDLSTATPLAPSFMTGTNGSVVIPGALTANTFNNVLYVGGPITTWGSGDIGSQINAAYAALPANGGRIVIVPSLSPLDSCYQYNTPIEFTTVSKYVVLSGSSPPQISSAGAVSGGSCIQYTPTTATHAIDIDWTPTGGGGYMAGAGIRDLVIVNSSTNGGSTQCITNGGCGSSATGVYIGNAGNGGAHKGYFESFVVKGFGVGFDMGDAGGIGWGITINNSAFILNTIGIQDLINVGHENTTLTGCVIAVNGTGINTTGTPGGDMTIVGGSIDSNTTGINTHTGNYIFNVTDVHWENPGVISTVYFAGSGQFYMKGGLILDDTNGGTSAQNWFSFTKGSMSGFTFSGGNAGRTYTGLFMNPSLAGHIDGANGNPTAWPNLNNICPPTTCIDPQITAQNGFGNSWLLSMSTSLQSIGQPTVASTFYLRDKTTGGSVFAIVDNATPFISVSNQVGPIAWTVTATPSSGQIGVQYGSGGLQVIGHTGDTATHSIYYQQRQVETSFQ